VCHGKGDRKQQDVLAILGFPKYILLNFLQGFISEAKGYTHMKVNWVFWET